MHQKSTVSPTTRVAIYTRVSSTGQEDNSSLRTQEAACRVYAAEHGWQVVSVYSDVHTGAELFERPGLTHLREAVRAGGIDVVLAHALDRLSREQSHLGLLFSECDHAGVALALATETLDDTPEGRLMLAVHGYGAEVDRLKIRERTMRGRRDRIAGGLPPVKVRLEENPETAPIVRRIFAEIAAGSSTRQVAKRLTAEGVPTPTGKRVWNPPTICGLLRHPTYTGNVTAWRWRQEKIKGRGIVQSRRPAEEQVVLPDAAPALVAPDLAAKAQARLASNRQESVRNNRNPEAFLLRGGIGRCGYCGKALQAYTPTKQGPLYRCNTTARDRYACGHHAIAAAKLDAEVWESIRCRLTKRERIAAELARLRTDDPTRADTASLDRRIGEIARRQRNLMADLADEDNPDLRALIRADVARGIEEQRQLEDERADLDRKREGWRLAQTRLDELDLWVKNVAANLDEFDYAKKRVALSELGAEVRLWGSDHDPRWRLYLRPDVFATEQTSTDC